MFCIQEQVQQRNLPALPPEAAAAAAAEPAAAAAAAQFTPTAC